MGQCACACAAILCVVDARIEIFSVRLGNVPSVAQQNLQWRQVLRGDPCAYCGAASRGADHIHASWTGGEDGWTNLTASCRRCNRSKQSRSLLSFLSGSAVGEDQRTMHERRVREWHARWDAADDAERTQMIRLRDGR